MMQFSVFIHIYILLLNSSFSINEISDITRSNILQYYCIIIINQIIGIFILISIRSGKHLRALTMCISCVICNETGQGISVSDSISSYSIYSLHQESCLKKTMLTPSVLPMQIINWT